MSTANSLQTPAELFEYVPSSPDLLSWLWTSVKTIPLCCCQRYAYIAHTVTRLQPSFSLYCGQSLACQFWGSHTLWPVLPEEDGSQRSSIFTGGFVQIQTPLADVMPEAEPEWRIGAVVVMSMPWLKMLQEVKPNLVVSEPSA